MFKPLTVLFVLGLALGLWIGFNPQMHEKVVQGWANAPTFFTTMKANISDTTHSWVVSLQSSGQTEVQKMTVVRKQASSIFTTIWDSAHRIWMEITFRLRSIK